MRAADARQYVHALSGGGAFLLYYFSSAAVAGLVAAGGLFSVAVSLLHQRREGSSGGALPTRLHRAHETPWRSGAVHYGIGVVLALLLFPAEAAFVGWLVLAGGDSAATLAGSRWPVVRLGANRSLGGLIGFAVGAAVFVWGGLAWWHGALPPALWLAGGVVAVICALSEAFVPRIDDNLFLPSLAAGVYLLMT